MPRLRLVYVWSTSGLRLVRISPCSFVTVYLLCARRASVLTSDYRSLASSVIIPHWFLKQRGRAFALDSIGGFVSAVIFPPFVTLLIGMR